MTSDERSAGRPAASGQSRMTYKEAGVDVEAGDRLVDWLQASGGAPKGQQATPHADKIVSGIGGFAALFRFPFGHLKKPCLVASTDGVGTKIKLAADFKTYEGVGQDLVAMCVNDLVCCGAEPLFFLDYYATSKLDLEAAQSFLKGVRQACHASSCALIGGETAEMPGLYQPGDFDAAGFAVGVVDEDDRLGPHRVAPGSVVLGISSSGFHSNGYSLLRKAFAEDLEVWKDVLMAPTHLYASLVLGLKRENALQAVANITGGGMENLPRAMPPGTRLRLLDWAWPEPFLEVQDRTGLSREEMLKTLNCGIGLALVVESRFVDACESAARAQGYSTYRLGEVERGDDPAAEAAVIY